MPDTLPDATPVAWLNVNQKLHTPNDNQMCITNTKNLLIQVSSKYLSKPFYVL